LGITDNNEKYYIYNICSNNNDEPIQVVISVSVSESVLFIADISVIGISVNLLIGAPLHKRQLSIIILVIKHCSFSLQFNEKDMDDTDD